MASIEWRNDFESGIDDVDVDHAQLIDAINALLHGLGEEPSRSVLADVLGQIRGKIWTHFAFEEKMMRDRSYDQYAEHKADHDFLLDEIGGLINSVNERGSFVHRDALIKRLSLWFAEHFKMRDRRLHQICDTREEIRR